MWGTTVRQRARADETDRGLRSTISSFLTISSFFNRRSFRNYWKNQRNGHGEMMEKPTKRSWRNDGKSNHPQRPRRVPLPALLSLRCCAAAGAGAEPGWQRDDPVVWRGNAAGGYGLELLGDAITGEHQGADRGHGARQRAVEKHAGPRHGRTALYLFYLSGHSSVGTEGAASESCALLARPPAPPEIGACQERPAMAIAAGRASSSSSAVARSTAWLAAAQDMSWMLQQQRAGPPRSARCRVLKSAPPQTGSKEACGSTPTARRAGGETAKRCCAAEQAACKRKAGDRKGNHH